MKSSMTYVNDEMRQKEKKQNHTPAVKFDHVTFTYAGAGAPSLKDISFQRCREKRLVLSEEPEVVNQHWYL